MVATDPTAGRVVLAVVRRLTDVLELVDGVVAVDIPIGLPDEPGTSRACDVEARRRIGDRRSSVFPAPSRQALTAPVWTRELRMSKQAWGIVPKLREADDTWCERLVECHPEVSFTELAGAPMRHHKATPPGRAERLAALQPCFLAADLTTRLPGAAADDVLDAVACLWSAHRVANGLAVGYGDDTRDARGRPMRIEA